MKPCIVQGFKSDDILNAFAISPISVKEIFNGVLIVSKRVQTVPVGAATRIIFVQAADVVESGRIKQKDFCRRQVAAKIAPSTQRLFSNPSATLPAA